MSSNPYAYLGLALAGQNAGNGVNSNGNPLAGGFVGPNNAAFPHHPMMAGLPMSMNMNLAGGLNLAMNMPMSLLQPSVANGGLPFVTNRVLPSTSNSQSENHSKSQSPDAKEHGQNRERDKAHSRDRRSRDREPPPKRRADKKDYSRSNVDHDDDVMLLSSSPSSNNSPVPPTWNELSANNSAPLSFPMNMMGMNMNMLGGTMVPDPALLMNPHIPFDFGLMGLGVAPTTITKDVIQCKSCNLLPPNAQAPPPTTRERPPGCRTVFVGGLPDNITEEALREIFERCGEITTVRTSKKNFAHVRFELECYVDSAIALSGYRLKLNVGSGAEASNGGRLHVDYAQARDDLYEWECRQRQLQREQRHRQRVQEELLRPPSPPPVVTFSEHEAQALVDCLKGDDTFVKGVQVLYTWLDRGDCSKRNSNTFYSLLQSAHAHVRRLASEKASYEDELKKTRDSFQAKLRGLVVQLRHIDRAFTAANRQKVWDHFTKAQRKNIEAWKKQVADLHVPEEFLDKGDDMDVSDSGDEDGQRKKRKEDKRLVGLKEDNDNLRCQLEASKNEVDLVRSDLKTELEFKDKQLKILQQTLQNVQLQLMGYKRNEAVKKPEVIEVKDDGPGDAKEAVPVKEAAMEKYEQRQDVACNTELLEMNLSGREAHIIGLVSVFLSIHPNGASLESIESYVRMSLTLAESELVNVLLKYGYLFPKVESKYRFGCFA